MAAKVSVMSACARVLGIPVRTFGPAARNRAASSYGSTRKGHGDPCTTESSRANADRRGVGFAPAGYSLVPPRIT